MNNKLWIVLALCALATACREVPVVEVESPTADPLKEQMIGANRLIAQSEESLIDAYVERRGWQMRRLSDGVRVMETDASQPRGAAIGYDDTVAITYSVEALNGSTVYSMQYDTVTVGRLKPNRGIDAALRTLHRGSQARIILPSEQAYGVVGDGARIGSRMVLVYDLKVE